MFALLFSPEESRTPDQIVQEELLPWLHMVHTQSPGAHVFLACSRAESPPSNQPDPSAWRQHIEGLANEVEGKVCLVQAVDDERASEDHERTVLLDYGESPMLLWSPFHAGHIL